MFQRSLCSLMILGLLITASGCIQMEHDLQIQTNGSAVYSLQYAISEQAISQFRAMFKLRRDLSAAKGEPVDAKMDPLIMTFLDPSTTTIREHLLPWQQHGIEIRTLRQNTRPLWRDFSIVLDIDDIGGLPQIPFFQKYGFSLSRNQEGQYVLDRPAMVTDPGAIPPRFSPSELEQIQPFLGGFTTDIKIDVPGRIVSTTAGRTSMQSAIWNFHFDRQPESVHQLMKQQLYVVFQAPSVTLPLFSREGQN
ncbi:MAG: hypothetical protein ACNA71_01500 [Kiritimatiellia bacterium]